MFVAMSKRKIEVPWICQAIRISMTCASEAHLSSAKIDKRLSTIAMACSKEQVWEFLFSITKVFYPIICIG